MVFIVFRNLSSKKSMKSLKFIKLYFSKLIFVILIISLSLFFFFYSEKKNDLKFDTFNISNLLEEEVFKHAFTDNVYQGELYYESINSLNEIKDRNDSIFLNILDFDNAYKNIEIKSTEEIKIKNKNIGVIKINFDYKDKIYEAFSYGSDNKCDPKSSASLVIPGSNSNQSLSIISEDTKNYHYGIISPLKKINSKIFVLIKPNEDFLAWHNGKGKKLGGDFIYAYHVNRQGSYSASYILQSLAFTKWMKKCYGKIILAGLSQGGGATLLNAMQSKPDYAIIASGFTLYSKFIDWSGFDQILNIPNYHKYFDEKKLIDSLKKSPTKWMFSWGEDEVGLYKIEALNKFTAKKIQNLKNVKTIIHTKGHVYDHSSIENFLLKF